MHMVIDFSHDADNYKELLEYYGKWSYTCPTCHAVGQWQRHGTYSRYLLISDENEEDGDTTDMSRYKWKTKGMQIVRLRCTECRHTHAILAKDMIPFATYAIRSIVKVTCYWMNKESIAWAEKIGWVSHQQLYRCVKCFEKAKMDLESLQRKKNQRWQDDPETILQIFGKDKHPSVELSFFLCYHNPIFMQRRATVCFPFLWEVFIKSK